MNDLERVARQRQAVNRLSRIYESDRESLPKELVSVMDKSITEMERTLQSYYRKTAK